MHKISVVIPTCNRPDTLKLCLNRLSANIQNMKHEYEIIVTDDSKDDLTKKLIEDHYPKTRWIKGPERGPCANRNNGASIAKNDIIVFLDDDCIPSENLLKSYSSYFKEHPEVLAIEGAIIPLGPQVQLNEECPMNINGGALWSCNFAIKSKIFRELGGFDERITVACYDDIEFGHRLSKSVERIPFLKEASVYHPWRTFKAIPKIKKINTGINQYLLLHPDEIKNFKFILSLKFFISGIIELIYEIKRLKKTGIFTRTGYIILRFLVQIKANITHSYLNPLLKKTNN